MSTENTEVKNTQAKSGGFCKSVCWLLGIAAGGYLAYALVTDFGVEQVRAGVLGIVTMLLAGLLLRRLLCRGNANRLNARLKEAPVQTEKQAEAVVAKAAASVAATSKSRVAQKSEKAPAAFEAPPVAEVDNKLTEIVTKPVEQVSAADAAEPEVAASTARTKKRKTSSSKSTRSKKSKTSKSNAIVASASDMQPDAQTGVETHEPVPGSVVDEDLNEKAKEAIMAIKEAAVPLETSGAEIMPAALEPEAAEEAEIDAQPEPVEPIAAAPEVAQIKPLEPKGLDGPENGAPDELGRIDGIGEDQEQALHRAGIYHFNQFVSMNRRELVWLDENIRSEDGVDTGAMDWRKQAIAFSREAG